MERRLIFAVGTALLLTGCVTHENDRATIGRSVRLEAFDPPAPPASDGAPVLPEQSPTLAGISRDNWEPTRILIPVDGTAHRPVYNQHLYLAEQAARQRGEYPTPTSALDLTEGSEWDQQLEALGNDLLAVADVVLLIPRLVLQPPWRTEYSPKIAYGRYWHPVLTPAITEASPLPPPPAPGEPTLESRGGIEVSPSTPE